MNTDSRATEAAETEVAETEAAETEAAETEAVGVAADSEVVDKEVVADNEADVNLVAKFDDVDAILDNRMIGTFIVPLADVNSSVLRNSREEDSSPEAIFGIQGTLGTVEDSFDTSNQIQEVSVAFYDDQGEDGEAGAADGLGSYAGFTRLTAMKRIALQPIIEKFNEAMGKASPSDEGYIVPDGRGVTVEDYDNAIGRISYTSEEWDNDITFAMLAYAVRVRTSDITNKEAYIKSTIENTQRSNPSTGAKASGCAFMRSEYGMSGKEISNETGLLQAHVSQYLLISDIPKILVGIVEEEEGSGAIVDDSQRELLALCVEEWGRRTYLQGDDSCAILISHARVLGPALRGHKKNSVDLTAAIGLMCELCRVNEETGKVNRKEHRPDLATFTALVNSAKEYGAPSEVQTELASDEIASLIATQGGGVTDDIDSILGNISDDSEVGMASGIGDVGEITGDIGDVDISDIISTGEAAESDVNTVKDVADVADVADAADAVDVTCSDPVAESVAEGPSSDGVVDFGDLGDVGEIDGEGDDFAMPTDDALEEIDTGITGELRTGSIDADDIAESLVESKPRSTLIKKAERSLMLIHTANEGIDESDDSVVRIFGCRPALTLVQLATSAALSDAANDTGKEELNNSLSKFLDGVDEFLSEVVDIAAESLNSADFAKLVAHAKKLNLDTIV